MADLETFDILIFGGGKAGKTLAMDQGRAGKKVAMVEAGMIGGSCINVACIPSKALIRSAEVAHAARNTTPFGTHVFGVETRLEEVRDRTASVVAEMVATNQAGFDASGFELILGRGKFVFPKVIEVDTAQGVRRVTGAKVFINLGSVADVPDIPGLRDAEPMTHVEALQLGTLPSRLVVIGGGFVGMELGQAFRRLGSEVAIVERGPRLASHEDEDVSEAITRLLDDEDVEIVARAGEMTVSGRSGDAVTVMTSDGRSVRGSHLLVAAGRQPAIMGAELGTAGVQVDERGYIKVDEYLRTTANDTWAMGDVAGTPMFTHASLDDYRVVASQLKGGTRTKRSRLIPSCVFIDPEFARVGMNETEAKAQGVPYRIARLPLDVVPRARTLSRRIGFMKALVAHDTDEILGFAMLGERAGDVMTVVQMTMLGGLPFTALRDGILAHPTISEGLNMLFANVK